MALALFGHDQLWPIVIIDSSPATDSGFLSYQFAFSNRPYYPIRMASVAVSAIDVRWLDGFGDEGGIKGMRFVNNYADVRVGPSDAVTLKLDNIFDYTAARKLKPSSRILISVKYQFPLHSTVKTDSALFEVARDSSGNELWIKKPLTALGRYVDRSTIMLS